MKDYILKRVTVGELQTDCYIIKDRRSRAACVIDPGGDLAVIKNELFEADASVKLILLTHGHIDHILALDDLRTPKTVVCIHKDDAHMLAEHDIFSGMVKHDPRPMKPADFLFEKDGKYKVGPFEFEVISTPGHTDGSVCYIFEDCIFSGDTLFKGSVGTVVFGGSEEKLRTSLERLYRYPGDMAVYPGHGPATSLSDERLYNPFFEDCRKKFGKIG